ncbi:hypothetical protein G8A07_15195 [Roseateles sp. DAIF2]|uniref:hypothetical protein n=1 Tax=Roseateles sp. DAIF2 TaxID=2714952 RepID=UPI0018A2C6D5|nr:hypothetical protein [Roseateles sp. DAIF2]QPF74127.1 hypothetical protein G8A07_15195 [Roseateles sp. DAIF2]
MPRWLRHFICCLLLPAYALAAGMVAQGAAAPAALQVEGHAFALPADEPGQQLLLLELGDTSDDNMAEHCVSSSALPQPMALLRRQVLPVTSLPAGRCAVPLLRPPQR